MENFSRKGENKMDKTTPKSVLPICAGVLFLLSAVLPYLLSYI